jgi:hypothetical protein
MPDILGGDDAAGRAAGARPPRKHRQACARRAAVPHLPGQRAREPATAWTQPGGGITAERGAPTPHAIHAANRLHIPRMP